MKRARQRLILARLDAALDAQMLDVHFQPIVDAIGQRIVGIEALARLGNEREGWIPPDEFISLAERHGRMDRLFEQLCAAALPRLKAWRQQGHDVRLNLNVSRIQLQTANFARRLLHATHASGLTALNIVVEITETLPASSTDSESSTLRQLATYGFALALDDLGSGHARLEQLPDCPWRVIKFDASLIARLRMSAETRRMIELAVWIARHAGMETVAEGIEDHATAALCADLGITALQGHLFCKAMTAEECTRLLEENLRARHAPPRG